MTNAHSPGGQASVAISVQQRSRVEALLGRAPRGLRAIEKETAAGEPVVIRVASLVDDKPFPTLFWLVDKAINYRIDQLEAGGLIASFQAIIDANDGLQASMKQDHAAHIALRDEYLTEQDRALIQRLGFTDVMVERGIGGIVDKTRIRCLHTWYAAHLVNPNTIGLMLERHCRDNLDRELNG